MRRTVVSEHEATGTTSGLLTRVACRSGVAGAVAGAAETVPGLPAPAAVLAVVGHTPAKGGGVNV